VRAHHAAHGSGVREHRHAELGVALQQRAQCLHGQHQHLGAAARVQRAGPRALRTLVVRQLLLRRTHRHLLLVQQQRRLRARFVARDQHPQRHPRATRRRPRLRIRISARGVRAWGGGLRGIMVRQLQ
jgi:hypothetical protein